MPLFGSKPGDGATAWEPQAAAGRLAGLYDKCVRGQ